MPDGGVAGFKKRGGMMNDATLKQVRVWAPAGIVRAMRQQSKTQPGCKRPDKGSASHGFVVAAKEYLERRGIRLVDLHYRVRGVSY